MSDRRTTTARFVLGAAAESGLKLGTDGYWLDVVYPRGFDPEVARSFSRALCAPKSSPSFNASKGARDE
jgi:hypothetical protein